MSPQCFATFGSGLDRPTLICLPHVGAGASMFHRLSEKLAPSFSVMAVRFPGRETRIGEKPIRQFSGLIDALESEIVPHLPPQFALLGDCSGSIVAFELTRRLLARQHPPPAKLYVLSHSAPHLSSPEGEDVPIELFLDDYRKSAGGDFDEVLGNEEIMALVAPVLEADFEAAEDYVYVPGPPLPIPIDVLGGESDPWVHRSELEAWQVHSTESLTTCVFQAGHFLLEEDAALEAIALGFRESFPH